MTWHWTLSMVTILVLCIPTVITHIIGIVFLFQVKHTNQISIMINLSLSELLYCMHLTVKCFVKLAVEKYVWKNLITLRAFFMVVDMFSMFGNKLLMIYLVTDRFLAIHFSVKYDTYFQKDTVLKILACIWFSCGLYGLFPAVLVGTSFLSRNEMYSINNYVTLVLDLIFTVAAISIYIYLYHIVKRMRKRDISLGVKGAQICTFANFIIPSLMVASYLIFNVSSTILWQVWQSRMRSMNKCSQCQSIYLLAYSLGLIGFLIDGILYIFLQKNVREFLITKFQNVRCMFNLNKDRIFPMREATSKEKDTESTSDT